MYEYFHRCLTPSCPSDSSAASRIRGLLVLKHYCYIHTHEDNLSPVSTTYIHMCLEMITWYWITDLQRRLILALPAAIHCL